MGLLQLAHVGGGWPFLALLDRELDPIALLQAAKPWLNDGGVMHKYILPLILGNESVAFLIAEPLDGSSFRFTHFLFSFAH
jgi:hypothetical protein